LDDWEIEGSKNLQIFKSPNRKRECGIEKNKKEKGGRLKTEGRRMFGSFHSES
jgi:hypothetical protein